MNFLYDETVDIDPTIFTEEHMCHNVKLVLEHIGENVHVDTKHRDRAMVDANNSIAGILNPYLRQERNPEQEKNTEEKKNPK